jgi:hypothetical protein
VAKISQRLYKRSLKDNYGQTTAALDRGAVAYHDDGRGQSLSTAASGAARYRQMPWSSISDGTGLTNEEWKTPDGVTTGVATLRVFCICGGYLYAAAGNTGIYRITEAEWALTPRADHRWIKTSTQANINRIFGLASGRILVEIIGTPNVVQYSDDGGATLTACTLDGGGTFPLQGGTAFDEWNFHQAPHGTACLSEYTKSGVSVAGAADNGVGLIRITANGHGFQTGDKVIISSVVGTAEANGTWTITRIGANTLDLQGSVFANAYVSGGTIFSSIIHVYRSTNGIAWTTVWTSTAGEINHCHGVGYHGGTSTWLQSCGDTTKSGLLSSTDDALNWAYYTGFETGKITFQPIGWTDIGHATKILHSADTEGQAGWFDVVTGAIEPLLLDGRLEATRGFTTNYLRYNGVVYVGLMESAGSGRQPAIYASANLVDWVCVHQFADGSTGTYLRGFFGGQLHGSTVTPASHFVMSPVSLASVGALAIGPAVTNALNTANLSSIETSIAGVSSPSTVVRDTTQAYHGSASAKLSAELAAPYCTTTPGQAAVAGTLYYGSFWVKSTRNVIGTARLETSAGGVGWNTNANNNISNFGITQGRWTKINLAPFTCPVGDDQIRIRVDVKWRGGAAGNPIWAYMDLFQISDVQGFDQLGGVAGARDRLQVTATMPAAWTNLFTIYPIVHADYLGSAVIPIRTYKAGADDYASILYDAGNKKIGIQRTVATVPQAAVWSAALYFHQNSPIRLALRSDGTNLKLSYANGAAVVHLTDDTVPGLVSGSVSILTGDNAGDGPLPHWLAQDVILNEAGNDASTAAAMAKLYKVRRVRPGLI